MSTSNASRGPLSMRRASHHDVGFCREVHHAALRDVVTRQFGDWIEAAQDVFFADDWFPELTSILELGDVPCGYCRIERLEHEYVVHAVYLLPSYQTRGLGTEFLRSIVERADNDGVPTSLQVLHANRAVSLYKRLGFCVYKQTETHLCMRREVRATTAQ